MQRSFLRFFVYSPLISESWTPQKSLSEFRPQSYNAGPQSQENTPREGSDAAAEAEAGACQISIHAPREGSDQNRREHEGGAGAFQSTLPVRGATHRLGELLILPAISIHAPREGSDHGLAPATSGGGISIHAPREGSDPPTWWRCGTGDGFQSTLPVRGATRPTGQGPGGKQFQSTLPVRGATAGRHSPGFDSDISIHAPREGSDGIPVGLLQFVTDFNPRSP